MRRIKLTRNKYAIIDDEDYDLVSQYKWHAVEKGRIDSEKKYYACTNIGWDKNKRRHEKKLYMHRLIMGECDYEIDHKNLETLDNRKQNLRCCTKSQNAKNRGLQINNRSGLKGVYWNKCHKKWHVQVKVDDRKKHIGYYDDLIEAGKEYDRAVKKYYGKYAKTNKDLGLL